MKLYPEMFVSVWHLIPLGMIVIAWISLWLGGYDRKTAIKSGLRATVLLYIIATLPIAMIMHDKEAVEERMAAALDSHYAVRLEEGRELTDVDQIAAVAASFRDDDGYSTYIYAGNYSDAFSFSGSLRMTIYDEDGEVLHEEVYENVVMQPGEKRKIDDFYSTRYAEEYQYKFSYLP